MLTTNLYLTRFVGPLVVLKHNMKEINGILLKTNYVYWYNNIIDNIIILCVVIYDVHNKTANNVTAVSFGHFVSCFQ